MSALADEVHVDPAVVGYVAAAGRGVAPPARTSSSGLSARGCLAFIRVAKTWAAADGRDHVVPDDVQALAQPVLCHRLLLDAEAQFAGVTVDTVIIAGCSTPSHRPPSGWRSRPTLSRPLLRADSAAGSRLRRCVHAGRRAGPLLAVRSACCARGRPPDAGGASWRCSRSSACCCSRCALPLPARAHPRARRSRSSRRGWSAGGSVSGRRRRHQRARAPDAADPARAAGRRGACTATACPPWRPARRTRSCSPCAPSGAA